MQGLSEVANFVNWGRVKGPQEMNLSSLLSEGRSDGTLVTCCRFLASLKLCWGRGAAAFQWSCHRAFPIFSTFEAVICVSKDRYYVLFHLSVQIFCQASGQPHHTPEDSPFGAVSEAQRPQHKACLSTSVVRSYTTDSSCINALYSHYMEILVHLGVFEVALAVQSVLISSSLWAFYYHLLLRPGGFCGTQDRMTSSINFDVPTSDRFAGLIFPNFCYYAHRMYRRH